MKFYITEKGLKVGGLMAKEYDAAIHEGIVGEPSFPLPPQEGDILLADELVSRTDSLFVMAHLGSVMYNILVMAGHEGSDISPPAIVPEAAITLTTLRSNLWFSIGEKAMDITQGDISRLKELGYLGTR